MILHGFAWRNLQHMFQQKLKYLTNNEKHKNLKMHEITGSPRSPCGVPCGPVVKRFYAHEVWQPLKGSFRVRQALRNMVPIWALLDAPSLVQCTAQHSLGPGAPQGRPRRRLSLPYPLRSSDSVSWNFGGLVLGYINADFYNEILILQHFWRSTKWARWIFPNFVKLLKNLQIFAKSWWNSRIFAKKS